MSYYMTLYELNVQNVQDYRFHELRNRLKEMSIIDDILDNGYYSEKSKDAIFYGNNESVWDSHDLDMLSISKQFPEMTFKLKGDGENREDMWETYYHNNVKEECRAVIRYPRPKTITWIFRRTLNRWR